MRSLEEINEMTTRVREGIDQLEQAGDDTEALVTIADVLNWTTDPAADDSVITDFLPIDDESDEDDSEDEEDEEDVEDNETVSA